MGKLREKSSFSLFEVLISLVILSIVLITLIKLEFNSDQITLYYELQEIENKYIETGVVQSTSRIKFQHQ